MMINKLCVQYWDYWSKCIYLSRKGSVFAMIEVPADDLGCKLLWLVDFECATMGQPRYDMLVPFLFGIGKQSS